MAVNRVNGAINQALFVNTAGTINTAQIIGAEGLGTPAISSAVAGDTQVTLTWSAVDGATNYDVRVDGSTILSDVGSSPYAVTSLTNDTKYDFEVRATDGASDGEWSAVVSRTPTAVVAPTYTPIVAMQFSGTPNASISQTGFAANPGAIAPTYSNEITGPAGEATTGRFSIAEDSTQYGARFTQMNNIETPDGSDIWISKAYYFPEGFCAGYKSGSDGYGSTKWERLQYSETGQRITLQLSGFSADACSMSSLMFDHLSLETLGPEEVCTFQNPGEVDRGTWVKICWHTRCTQDNTGFIEGWLSTKSGDDWITEYLGLTENESRGNATAYQTIPSADDTLDNHAFGMYMNGSAFQTTYWFCDHIIVSVEEPSTSFDGKPFISPYHSPVDFS